MEFPKLRSFLLYALSSLSLLGYFSLHAQATSSPTIYTNLGVGSVIDICKNDQLNLIGSGDAGLTSSTFEFFRTRNGSTTIVRANDASNNFTTSDLQNGDHFYVRVNRILPLPAVSANSSSITINITPTPEIQSLTSDQTGNTFCANEHLTFTAQASKLKSFNLTSFGISVGTSLENFDFGLQYNVPIIEINQVYAPSILELLVTFDFSIYRRNNRGIYKRLATDNY